MNAEHDNLEPITEDWLSGLGFTRTGNTWYSPEYLLASRIYWVRVDGSIRICDLKDWLLPNAVKLDLRTLCWGLGCPINEPDQAKSDSRPDPAKVAAWLREFVFSMNDKFRHMGLLNGFERLIDWATADLIAKWPGWFVGQASGWRPIAEADQVADGRDVLLWHNGPYVGWFDKGIWWDAHNMRTKPTHFMEIEPPADRGEQKGEQGHG